MKVKVYAVDQQSGAETFLHWSEWSDILNDNEMLSDSELDELVKHGRVWIGGGAAPLFLLARSGA